MKRSHQEYHYRKRIPKEWTIAVYNPRNIKTPEEKSTSELEIKFDGLMPETIYWLITLSFGEGKNDPTGASSRPVLPQSQDRAS